MTSRKIVPPRSFTPGQWAGSYAAGVPDKERGFVGGTLSTTPAGERTATEFPWISSIMGRIQPAAASYLRFTRPGGEPSFYNNTNRPIRIDEIRIYAMPIPQVFLTDSLGNPIDLNIQRYVGVRIYSQKKEYIRDYLPLWNINTESNRITQFQRARGSFKLPSPYYLNRGNAMQIRLQVFWPVIAAIARSTILDFAFGFQGTRAHDRVDIKLMRQLTVATAGTTQLAPLYQTIPFNDNRDFPLVDCNLEHFGFGVRDVAATAVNSTQLASFPANWVMVQFVPPQGPKWMGDNDWVPLWALQDQPGALWYTGQILGAPGPWDDSMIIYRPVTPYVLQPREELSVELKTLLPLTYAPVERVPGWVEAGRGVPVWCTMYGRQESLA